MMRRSSFTGAFVCFASVSSSAPLVGAIRSWHEDRADANLSASSLEEIRDMLQDSVAGKSMLKDRVKVQQGDAAGMWCPTLAAPTVPDHDGVSLSTASVSIMHYNCDARGNTYMCAFPIDGLKVQASSPEALQDSVTNLDQGLFDARVAGTKSDNDPAASVSAETMWIVEYYADWCPHCRAFAPQWVTIGLTLRELGLNVRLASVNCEVHEQFCSKQAVPHYPHVAWYYRGSNAEVRKQLRTVNSEYEEDVIAMMRSKKARFKDAPRSQLKQIMEERGVGGGSLVVPESGLAYGELKGTFSNLSLVTFFGVLPSEFSPGREQMSDIMINAKEAASNLVQCPSTRASTRAPQGPKIGWPSSETTATVDARLADAGFMAVYMLKRWMSPTVGPSSDEKQFTAQDVSKMATWMWTLAKNFPLARDLFSHVAGELHSRRETGLCVMDWYLLLKPLLKRFGTKPLANTTCSTDTCRIWTLFHVLSLAPAVNWEGAQNGKDTAASIASFVESYFRCQHCKEHAVKQYVARAYGQRDLLADRTGRGSAIYWWRFHNAVSVRIAAENNCEGDRRWPSVDECPECWKPSDTAWPVLSEAESIFGQNMAQNGENTLKYAPVEDVVVEYLAKQFWPGNIDFEELPQTSTTTTTEVITTTTTTTLRSGTTRRVDTSSTTTEVITTTTTTTLRSGTTRRVDTSFFLFWMLGSTLYIAVPALQSSIEVFRA